MKILIVSGFLGAGKTTFIKELIRRTGKYFVVLENEYGENDLDSRTLKNSGELEILEFMEGCVCCTKKDSFVNTILSISAAIDPEFLIVEPTGIGKLGNIIDNIKKIQYEKITLLPPIVVLSPRSIMSNLRDYPEIYKDQIIYADNVVFTKCENDDSNSLSQAADIIHTLNPSASVLTNHYTLQNVEWWNTLLSDTKKNDVSLASYDKVSQNKDDFQQVSLHHVKMSNIAELIVLLEDTLRAEFGQIARAKGVLKVGYEFLHFDLADGLYGIISEESLEPKTQCVFIGKEINKDKLFHRLNTDSKCEEKEHCSHHHH